TLGSQRFAAHSGSRMTGGIDCASPWWDPGRHADRKPFLASRVAITKATRAWFEEHGFVEVETVVLQRSPGNETHLHAPRTALRDTAGATALRYLRTSPDFAA